MARLLLFVAGLIVYGSLFPFDFQATVVGGEALAALWPPEPLRMSRGDILANTLPFVPLGIVVAIIVGEARVGARTMVLALVGTWSLMVALQLAQILLPDRVAALSDAVWNGVGIGIGGVIGALCGHRGLLTQAQRDTVLSAPTILLAMWLTFKLMPLVPALDLREIELSLWPLVGQPELKVLETATQCLGWLIVAYLWRRVCEHKHADRWLVLAIGLIFVAEVIVADNRLTASEVAGAGLAQLFWWGGLRKHSQPPAALAAALIAVLVLSGLAPFAPRTQPGSFLWLPLAGAMHGSAITGMTVTLSKAFLYGGLVWLLHESAMSWRRSAVLAAAILGAVEAAQFFFAGHLSEVTDPLLALILAAVFQGLDSDGKDDDAAHMVRGRRPLRRKSWRPPRRAPSPRS